MNNNKLKTSFTTEDIESFIIECSSEDKLLPIVLEKIRNCEILSTAMIEKINMFENSNKIKIIFEYNKMMKYLIRVIDEFKDHSNAK